MQYVKGLTGNLRSGLVTGPGNNGDRRETYFDLQRSRLRELSQAQNARHKTFWNMVFLSLCVAVWITLVSVPVIRNGALRTVLFGVWRPGPPPLGQEVKYCEPLKGPYGNGYCENKTESLCGNTDSMFQYFYIPGQLQKPVRVDKDYVTMLDRQSWVLNETADDNTTRVITLDRLWCGFLPESYQSYWPNIAQLVIFTVYMSTGSTINLAWQGIIGTWTASLNFWVMKLMFPWGAKDCVCDACQSSTHEPCTSDVNGTNVNRYGDDGVPRYLEDPYYMEWVAWANTLFVILMFLLSKANENTIKFGLSWHVYYMMKFMNPDKGATPGYIHATEDFAGRWQIAFSKSDEEMVVMVTTVIGALIAIVATFVPRPLTNISKVNDDAAAITTSISTIWLEAINYFCSGEQIKERFQIKGKIEMLEQQVSGVQNNLAMSWWETFDMFGCGRIRTLYAKFDLMACDTNDFMHALQTSILDETFDTEHNQFCEKMKESMEKLHENATELMAKCCDCCRDGWIDDDETEELEAITQSVKENQVALMQAYNAACPEISLGLSNETIFVYALSLWARKVCDLAQEIDTFENQMQTAGCGAAFRVAKNGLWLTYNPEAMFEPEHLNFALRNFLSISITFYLGYTLGADGSIFTRYSATMASTLSLLISHFQGSAMQKNLQRLLGVSLGNVIPIMVTMGLDQMSCESHLRFYLHALGILIYTFTFTYMYYTSSQWSLVGCLIAGFGMNELIQKCKVHKEFGYDTKYKEIGMVTCALVIQLVIDALLVPESPRQMALSFTETVHEAMEEGFEAVFDSDLDKMRECYAAAKSALDSAKALAPECDPKLQVVGGMATEFKHAMYDKVLDTMVLLLSDLAMIIKAEEDTTNAGGAEDIEMPGSSGTLEMLNSGSSIGPLKDDLVPSLRRGFETLQVVLAHDTEEPIRDEGLDEIAKTHVESLVGRADLMKELGSRITHRDFVTELTDDRRCKLNVILRALRNAKAHIGIIEELCIKAGAK